MMYKSEEAEKELERKQLEQLHDQRIQAQLSTQEQQIFEDFMTAVDDNNVQVKLCLCLNWNRFLFLRNRYSFTGNWNWF